MLSFLSPVFFLLVLLFFIRLPQIVAVSFTHPRRLIIDSGWFNSFGFFVNQNGSFSGFYILVQVLQIILTVHKYMWLNSTPGSS